MKKRLASRMLVALTAAALLMLIAFAIRAGEYHDGDTLFCQECHVMHYSQSHDYSGNPSASPGGVGEGLLFSPPQADMDNGPTEKLLRDKANALCLSCHDGIAAVPDVQGASPLTTSTVRAGGALTEAGSEFNGHTMDSTDPAPGSGWVAPSADGFRCVDCHEPHGYVPTGTEDVAGNTVTSQYRNLHAEAGGSTTLLGISYEKAGTSSNTADVLLRRYYGDGNSIALRYHIDAMDLCDPDVTNGDSGMGRWCGGCHGLFHGLSSNTDMRNTTAPAGTNWLRHPTADTDIGGVTDSTHSSVGQFSGHTNNVKVMDPAGLWNGTGTGLTPTCLSCHKAHGNQNQFGLIYMAGTGTVSEEGDDGTELHDLCRQCHVQ
jgi:nitrate reductase cytochrome c-type subunit